MDSLLIRVGIDGVNLWNNVSVCSITCSLGEGGIVGTKKNWTNQHPWAWTIFGLIKGKDNNEIIEVKKITFKILFKYRVCSKPIKCQNTYKIRMVFQCSFCVIVDTSIYCP